MLRLLSDNSLKEWAQNR